MLRWLRGEEIWVIISIFNWKMEKDIILASVVSFYENKRLVILIITDISDLLSCPLKSV